MRNSWEVSAVVQSADSASSNSVSKVLLVRSVSHLGGQLGEDVLSVDAHVLLPANRHGCVRRAVKAEGGNGTASRQEGVGGEGNPPTGGMRPTPNRKGPM